MSDDEDELKIIQHQPYDEMMDVVDGEEVASFYMQTLASHRGAPVQNSTEQSGVAQLAREKHLPLEEYYDNRIATPPSENGDENLQDESNSDPPTSETYDGLPVRKEYKQSDIDGYDPSIYNDLAVESEIKDIFKCIEKYQAQDIILPTKLKPFIPEYIPAIGDIDAFLKVPRPDGVLETLGVDILDEPSSKQSDPHVLNLQMRYTSKEVTTDTLSIIVGNVMNADKNPKAIDEWIDSMTKLQKTKAVDIVKYRRAMPDIDSLMQEWPTQFEEILKDTSIPSAEIDIDLVAYIDILCALMDIPVYESRIHSLHSLFTLYLGFKNSDHFKTMANQSQPTFQRVGNTNATNQIILE